METVLPPNVAAFLGIALGAWNAISLGLEPGFLGVAHGSFSGVSGGEINHDSCWLVESTLDPSPGNREASGDDLYARMQQVSGPPVKTGVSPDVPGALKAPGPPLSFFGQNGRGT